MKSSLAGTLTSVHRKERHPWSIVLVLGVVMLFMGGGPGLVKAENWKRLRGWEITSIELIGLPEGISKSLGGNLALQGQRKLFKTVRPGFQPKLLADDLARIRLYLSRNGYPKAKTIPKAEISADSRQLKLIIEVDPGPVVKVGRLELLGWPDRVERPDTSSESVIHKGQVFKDEIVDKASTYLTVLLHDSGFESASVNPVIVGIEDGEIELHFEVTAGDYCLIDSVVVEGCSDDLVATALRVMNLDPGMEYSGERMRQAALDLRGTQLFGVVVLETENHPQGNLIAKALLENARMRSWYATVGTWSDNPWMVRMGWTHNNFFKNGVGLRTGGILGAHEASVRSDVFWLGWLTPRSLTSVGFTAEKEKELSYQSQEGRFEVIQAFRPNLRDMWKVGISTSIVNVETYTPDPDEAPDAQGPMLEFWSDWKWDRTDDPINPKVGHYFKVSFTFAPPEFISEAPYAQLQLDGVRYQPIGKGIVFAGRLRVGASKSFGDTEDILANRRFYAGGYNTMRGYERRHLGPADSAGDPRGGKFVTLAGLELRFPLLWLFNGAIFFDSGQVWREYSDVGSGTLAGATGVALDLVTPIGPLRLNYAANVMNHQEGLPQDMWTFGIGYPW